MRRPLGAIRESARNVGSVYGYDEWTLSPRLVLGYGTGFARYDYLGGPGVWSPRFSVTVPLDGFRVKALASRKVLVPGAEEFAPSVTGVWLPPERTFSSLAYDGRFTARTDPSHAGRHRARSRGRRQRVAARVRPACRQSADRDIRQPFRGATKRHSATITWQRRGDIDARGWGAGDDARSARATCAARSNTRSTTAYWDPASDMTMARAVRSMPLTSSEKIHDLQTAIEATIPQTVDEL